MSENTSKRYTAKEFATLDFKSMDIDTITSYFKIDGKSSEILEKLENFNSLTESEMQQLLDDLLIDDAEYINY